jgi:hypothetical protein
MTRLLFNVCVKKKRAAQGRRSGNHCGRHKKNLEEFQGTPRVAAAEAFIFAFYSPMEILLDGARFVKRDRIFPL